MNTEKLAQIAVKKSLLKEYHNSKNERIVYMNDNTEFQIQLFNPYTYVIGISFKFNDDNESSQKLILRPGERIWLDRYLNDESRFLFSTYEVDASKSAKKAIMNNGNIQIKFYKEKEQNYWYYNDYYINKQEFQQVFPKTIDVWYNNDISNSITTSCSTNSMSCNIDKNMSSITYTGSAASTIETGRIEKGNHSNQKFDNVYKDFDVWPFKTEIIKILPISQKQVNATDISKKYCGYCGRKVNQKFKYCPYCGKKI